MIFEDLRIGVDSIQVPTVIVQIIDNAMDYDMNNDFQNASLVVEP